MARQRLRRQYLEQFARDHLGYDQLRPGQQDALQALLKGQDTLVVMPTGSGKSAIYQLAALQLPRATVVVSPLISLQQDQVEAIQAQALGHAEQLNSAIKDSDRQQIFDDLEAGELEFIFLAPEQFNNEDTLASLQAAQPSLFVVDEAHCISEWGHDFRPDYLRLSQVIAALDHPLVLALTATASPLVRQEIVERLGLKEPQVIVQGFDRPNIWLGVERFGEDTEKLEALVARVLKAELPGIVYTATRKRAETVAAALCDRGVRAAFYHAGMKAPEREQVQTAFMNDEWDVIVATTAFGMGIDKLNVRFVFHYDISDSVDSYYQEIGRAGRDGEPAQALLFYNSDDLNLRRFFAGGKQIELDQLMQVAVVVQQADKPLDLKELQASTELSKSKLATAVNRLEEVGVVNALPTGEIVSTDTPQDDIATALDEAVQAQEAYQQMVRSRLEMMRGYAEVRDCRREYVLNYFGEQFEKPCNACDNCQSGVVVEEEELQPFPIDSRVTHKSWGEGRVMRYEGDKIVVLFDGVGYKTLGVKMTLLRQLLKRV